MSSACGLTGGFLPSGKSGSLTLGVARKDCRIRRPETIRPKTSAARTGLAMTIFKE